MKKVVSILAGTALALTLAACSDNASDNGGNSGSDTGGAGDVVAADLSGIEKVDELAALVPEDIAADGKLTVGINIFYAPAEFYAPDGKTPQGYDIDMTNAIAKVLGLEADFQQAEFASIIPAIGSKYEIGVANFTIKEEREQVVNMTQYFELGSQYSVPKGNPSDFDPADPCGASIGVQTGTWQDEVVRALNDEQCADNPVVVQAQDEQSRVTLALSSGQIDAMYTDNSVAEYAVKTTDGKIETIGDINDVGGVGVVTAKDNEELTEAVQKALQHLMDEGHLDAIFTTWGITEGVSTEAVLNPTTGQ